MRAAQLAATQVMVPPVMNTSPGASTPVGVTTRPRSTYRSAAPAVTRGAGGTTRLSRKLGAMMAAPFLLEGKLSSPRDAKGAGLIDEVVAPEDLLSAAKAWVLAAKDADLVKPWDDKGYKMPGGTPSTPALAMNLPAFPSNLLKQIKGANYPAPKAILCERTALGMTIITLQCADKHADHANIKPKTSLRL